MAKAGISRRTAVSVACMGVFLAAPTGAMAALTTHSATSSTPNSAGQLVATAKCGASEHVVSGGFNSPVNSSAVVSRAVHGDSWTVHLFDGGTSGLTTYAYCARKGGISQHESKVTAKVGPFNNVATARCASGKTLVSGGYAFLSTPSTQRNSPTFRDYAASAREWTVMSVFETVPAKLAAFAYCQRGVNVKVRSSSSARIHEDHTGSATATCHQGETLLSGGYTTTPRPDWQNTHGPDFFYYASHRSGARSWIASAINYSKVAGTITAFAYCKA